MNYSRGLQHSCCSKGEYEAQYTKRWLSVKDNPPPEGMAVLVLEKWYSEDPDFWTTELAYYCDGAFWNLEYDSNLGVMRKHFYGQHPEYWARYIVPDPSELKD